MTRKDYVKIADVFNSLVIGTLANTSCGGFRPAMNSNGWHSETVVECFCDMFIKDNPKFDKKKFIKACGFETWDELVMGHPIIKKDV